MELTFVFLCVIFRDSPFLRSSYVLKKDTDSTDSVRPIHYSTSDHRVERVPVLSPCSSLTLPHWSIGYHECNPQPLTESSSRVMYLRVYDSRDFPSLWYSFTHTHRSIGYLHLNPQSLTESSSRLMYLRVYDSRDSSLQSVPFPSLYYLLKHAHRSIGYHNLNPQSLTESSERLMYLGVYDSRDISHQSVPSPSLYYSLTHTHWSISYRNPVPMLLAHTCTQYPPHAHDHMHSGTLVSWVSGQDYSFLSCDN